MSSGKSVLITGANGLLGQNLTSMLSQDYHPVLTDVQPESFLSDPFTYIQTDITDPGSVQRLFEQIDPDFCIHTAAMTNVDGCEENPDIAEKVNVTGTKNLVDQIPGDCRFLHVSTDYVFDGKGGPYSEADPVNPVSVYGSTKLNAERVVSRKVADYLIVRTIVLFGNGIRTNPSFIHWVLGKLKSGQPFSVVDDQVGTTTLASNLAWNCKILMEKAPAGLYHVSGPDLTSRYEFAGLIAKIYGYNPDLISTCKTSDLNQKAERPLKSGFILDKIKGIKGIRLLNTEQQIKEFQKRAAL